MGNTRERPAPAAVRELLLQGMVIPAHPLALTADRRLDEVRQRGLSRYYHAAGANGLAVGVHTTQFEIRAPRHGLLRPVLQLAAETMGACDERSGRTTIRIAGVCGPTPQAVAEARLARELGFDIGLVSLAALQEQNEEGLIDHCRAVMEWIPIMGFYLQPAVGGRVLSYRFWRRLAELENLLAVKIAPFNRYQSLDVIRAVHDAGRSDIALYTGNDDNIVIDLLTPFASYRGKSGRTLRVVGGLLGQWAVWTSKAVSLLRECVDLSSSQAPIPREMLGLAADLTDANGALFDSSNGFRGCVPGIHEALRRQGLLQGIWCLDPHETLGPGQMEQIDRIWAAYPHLRDDEFVGQHLDEWLS